MSSRKPSASASKSTAGTKKQKTGASAARREKNAPQIKCSSKDSDHGLLMEDFPIDSKNPFAKKFCGSDTVLIVEGKKLHAHKAILCLYSPYFRALLGSHFAEASAREVELKSNECLKMKYEAVVKFLLHLYPVHSYEDIMDDAALTEMISLSDYFQCQHVRTKCVAYIQKELGNRNSLCVSSSCDLQRALLYLRLCGKYRVNQLIEKLFEIVSRSDMRTIQETDEYSSFTPEMQRDVCKERALYLEKRIR